MPSGGRGSSPPKSAQWVVSHYQIGFNNTLRVCMSASIFRRAYKPAGLPPAGAAVGVYHVVVCAGGCNVGIITLYQ